MTPSRHLCCPGCGCAATSEDGTAATAAASARIVTDYRALLQINDTSGARWNNGSDVGTGAIVTYAFLQGTDLPDPGTLSRAPDTTAAFSAAQRQAFRDAADLFSAASGLIFVEVEDPGNAMIDAHLTTGIDGTAGYASFAYATTDGYANDDGVLAMDYDASTSFAPGTAQFVTLVHEIGHAVGLQHTHGGSVVLDPDIDDDDASVMSYNGVLPFVETLGRLDHDALAHLYGAGAAVAGIATALRADGAMDVTGTAGDDRIALAIARTAFDGGAGDDHARGMQAADSLSGGAGDDTLLGGRGGDVLVGGGGSDRLSGEADADRLAGGGGDDALSGGWGADMLTGGDGRDRLRGDGDDDVLDGGAGVDRLWGGSGDDTLSGGDDKDRLAGEDGHDSIVGGDGNDRIKGGDGWDTIDAGRGKDRVDGGGGADSIDGGGHRDRLAGGAGGDTILGGRGHDRIDGGAGTDALHGGKGRDLVGGGADDDRLFGEGGSDDLRGGAGDDVLDGGRGKDVLAGGAGDDRLVGGGGTDTFLFDGGADTIADFDGDLIRVDTAGLAAFSGGGAAAERRLLDDAVYFGNATELDFGGGDTLLVFGLVGRDAAADALTLL